MAQIFRRRANSLARAGLVGAVLLAGAAAWAWHAVYWSPDARAGSHASSQADSRRWPNRWFAAQGLYSLEYGSCAYG
jgi:hypothetical protein